MTATYWQVGRHIVEFEQAGERRAGYGQQLLTKLSTDLTKRFGRGCSADNLETMRLFFLAYLDACQISEMPSRNCSRPPLIPMDEPVRMNEAALGNAA